MAAHTSCKWGSKDEQQVLLNMRGREGDKWGETKILGRSRRHESLFAHTVGYQGTCEGAGAGQQARLRVGDLSSESVFHRGKRAPRNQATEAWADQKPAPPPPENRGVGEHLLLRQPVDGADNSINANKIWLEDEHVWMTCCESHKFDALG